MRIILYLYNSASTFGIYFETDIHGWIKHFMTFQNNKITYTAVISVLSFCVVQVMHMWDTRRKGGFKSVMISHTFKNRFHNLGPLAVNYFMS